MHNAPKKLAGNGVFQIVSQNFTFTSFAHPDPFRSSRQVGAYMPPESQTPRIANS